MVRWVGSKRLREGREKGAYQLVSDDHNSAAQPWRVTAATSKWRRGTAAQWWRAPPHQATPAQPGEGDQAWSRGQGAEEASESIDGGHGGPVVVAEKRRGRPGEETKTKSPGPEWRGAPGGAHGTDGDGRDGRDQPGSSGGGADGKGRESRARESDQVRRGAQGAVGQQTESIWLDQPWSDLWA